VANPALMARHVLNISTLRPLNTPAPVNAMNPSSNVYSTISWPFSSFQNALSSCCISSVYGALTHFERDKASWSVWPAIVHPR
jgi:hypothetical protein